MPYSPHFLTVLDDEESIQRLLRHLLRSAEFMVERVASGVKSLGSLRTGRPGWLVLDIHRWVMTGFAVLAVQQFSVTTLAAASLALAAATHAAPAEEASSTPTEALAKAAQNPVANLISVPFQNNFNFGVGPNDVTQYILNVQPVIPISLNEDWNLITRTIIPIINQPSPSPGVPSAFGLGDINPTLFFSPAKSGKFIWGAGPTLTLPTATDSLLGNGLWSAGPAVVALTMQGPWVIGALANQQWSFAGWGDEDVSALLIQPFINYNIPHGWYLTSSPIITAQWREPGNNAWTVPVGGGVGKIVHLGKLPLNCQLGAYYNVKTPEDGPDWQLRAQIQFMFPK